MISLLENHKMSKSDMSKIFFILLLIVTISWAILIAQSIMEFNMANREDIPYQAWNKGQIMLLGGLVLLCLWMVIAVKKRNIFIGAAVLGIIITPAFYFLAWVEGIGYNVEIFFSWEGGGFYVTLNPFFHIGDDVFSSKIPEEIVAKSSMKIENLLLYLFYGELTSFSLIGAYLSIKKLKTHAHLRTKH